MVGILFCKNNGRYLRRALPLSRKSSIGTRKIAQKTLLTTFRRPQEWVGGLPTATIHRQSSTIHGVVRISLGFQIYVLKLS